MLPIHHAAKRGDWEEVAHQVEAGVSIDARKDSENQTPLMAAIDSSADTFETVRWLVRNGASPERIEADERNSLARFAIKRGTPEIVEFLGQIGMDFRYEAPGGYNALIDAVHSRAMGERTSLLPLIEVLLSLGASPLGESAHGESALRVASRVARFDVVKRLLEVGADPDQLEWTDLMHAVACGEVADAERLLASGSDLEAIDWWERTAWLLSVQTGSTQKAQLLLDAGSDFGARGRCETPALHLACEARQPQTVTWLIERGANLDARDEFGHTALMEAAEAGSAECVRLLLQAGARPDITDAIDRPFIRTEAPVLEGFPPIDPAVWDAYMEREANKEFNSFGGDSAIAKASTLEVARLLVEAGESLEDISEELRAELLGLETDSSPECSKEEFERDAKPCFGISNPEPMDKPFWEAMVRSDATAYHARDLFGATDYDDYPFWCYHRFGRSLTDLGGGRFLEIGGEHEDHYDPDFCIYNDAVLHEGDGIFKIFGYPQEVIPPTDFHSATLVGQFVYIIGGLGYLQERREGFTPVFRLYLDSMSIEQVKTSGDMPGWIWNHCARLNADGNIEISGGELWLNNDIGRNEKRFVLSLSDLSWHRV